MNEFRNIEDLRPAPRPTPRLVLWLMLFVVLGGAALLVVSGSGTPAPSIASAEQGTAIRQARKGSGMADEDHAIRPAGVDRGAAPSPLSETRSALKKQD